MPVVLGMARRWAVQRQLSRAIRPAQRTCVIVAPGGALNACPEVLKPAYVWPTSRLLIPVVARPALGQAEYALLRSPNGVHAALLYPNSPAESHEYTVYGRASAVCADDIMLTMQIANVAPTARAELSDFIALVMCG